MRRATGRLAAVVAALVALVALVLPGMAGAAGTRSVSTSLSCTPTTLTVGTTSVCTFTVADNASGAKTAPDGTVAFSITTPGRTTSLVPVTACTLVLDTAARRSTCSARLLLLGTGSQTVQASFTPTAADPHRAATASRSFNVLASGNPILYTPLFATFAGQSLAAGDSFAVYGAGCSSSGQWGQFVGYDRDPLVETDPTRMVQSVQTSSRTDGSWTWTGSIDAAVPASTYTLRFYCASSPVSSPVDAAITWMSPAWTFTVTEPATAAVAAAPMVMAAVTSPATATSSTALTASDPSTTTTTTVAQPVSSLSTVTASVDPDGTAGVDRLGLTGTQATTLKARVDAALPGSGRLTRLAVAALGRVPDRTLLDRWGPAVAAGDTSGLRAALAATKEFTSAFGRLSDGAFVTAAYQRVLFRTPTPTELSAATGQLAARKVTRIGLLAQLVERPEHVAATADRSYVLATYQAVTTVVPPQADLDRFVVQLRDTVVRVQVVEDVALTRATAATWTTALAGASRSTIRL